MIFIVGNWYKYILHLSSSSLLPAFVFLVVVMEPCIELHLQPLFFETVAKLLKLGSNLRSSCLSFLECWDRCVLLGLAKNGKF